MVAGINEGEKIGSFVSTQNHSNFPKMETRLCHSLVDKIKGLTTAFRIKSELSLQILERPLQPTPSTSQATPPLTPYAQP